MPPGVAALFDRMSAASRCRRYLTSKEQLSPRELRLLTDVDHVRHEAVAAVDTRDGSIVAIARYVQCDGRENRAARPLARRLGFRARSSRGREIELVLGVPATRSRPPVAGRRGP